MQVLFHDESLGLFEKMVSSSGRVVAYGTGSRQRREMASQRQHGIDQQRRAVLHLAPRVGWRHACLELLQKQVLGQGSEEAVMPAKVHAHQVLYELWVGSDRGPRAVGILDLLVLLTGVWIVGGSSDVVLVEVDEMRRATDVARRAVFEAQFAHLATELALECEVGRRVGWWGYGADGLVVVVIVVAVLASDDGFGDGIEALACADLADEVGDVVFGVVEDGLDQRLQGRVARLDFLLVDALAAVVRVGVVDALGVVDGGAGRTCWRSAVALLGMGSVQHEWTRGDGACADLALPLATRHTGAGDAFALPAGIVGALVLLSAAGLLGWRSWPGRGARCVHGCAAGGMGWRGSLARSVGVEGLNQQPKRRVCRGSGRRRGSPT
jgi:hypothetical protein